jgi:hypothetical protein
MLYAVLGLGLAVFVAVKLWTVVLPFVVLWCLIKIALEVHP